MNAPTVKQPEHFPDEAGAGTADPGGSPSLAQILARKTANDQLDLGWKSLQLSDVTLTVYVPHPRAENGACWIPNLT